MPDKIIAPSLPPQAFRRVDESLDQDFYAAPRFVTHIDDAAIKAVTDLYLEFFPANGAVLDLMSSWVSHFPPNIDYNRVVGLGMNDAELSANPRLTERVVQSLNANPVLPFGSDEFDAAAICVSVQYLIQPTAVFAELARVLKPGAPLVITFSNRCFPTKAIFAWNALDDENHIALVCEYFATSNGFCELEVRRFLPKLTDPLFAVIGRAK